MSILDSLYKPYLEELAAFRGAWIGPDAYLHGEWSLVAIYTKEDGGDGQTVEVRCSAMPARFYRITAIAGENSTGEKLKRWSLGTGSGCAELAATIAREISLGMLALKLDDEEPTYEK
jgi:hypothetical protein